MNGLKSFKNSTFSRVQPQDYSRLAKMITYFIFKAKNMLALSNIFYSSRTCTKATVRLSLAVCAALVSGCATISSVTPNTPVAEVIKVHGKPDSACKNADGTERLIWTGQPYGQFAWGTNTTKDGKIGKIEQILTDKQFEALTIGWTAEQLACQFGPPSNMYGIAKGHEIVWAYRYKQYDVWPAMMYVYMGPKGDRVTRFHPAPDPASLGDNPFGAL